jgi:hypothetical protein
VRDLRDYDSNPTNVACNYGEEGIWIIKLMTLNSLLSLLTVNSERIINSNLKCVALMYLRMKEYGQNLIKLVNHM